MLYIIVLVALVAATINVLEVKKGWYSYRDIKLRRKDIIIIVVLIAIAIGGFVSIVIIRHNTYEEKELIGSYTLVKLDNPESSGSLPEGVSSYIYDEHKSYNFYYSCDGDIRNKSMEYKEVIFRQKDNSPYVEEFLVINKLYMPSFWMRILLFGEITRTEYVVYTT